MVGGQGLRNAIGQEWNCEHLGGEQDDGLGHRHVGYTHLEPMGGCLELD